jgi:hypothetical protein
MPSFPPSLEDTSTTPIPVGQAYLDGQNAYAANQASPFTHTDSFTNTSSAPQVLAAPSTLGVPLVMPGIIQKASGVTGSGGKTLAIAFPNNVGPGNSIVVQMGMGEVEASGITLTLTDTQLLMYTQAGKGSQSTTQEAAIFYATNTILGANTVTITIAGASSVNTGIAAEIYEVEGLITVSSLIVDQTANNNNAGSTAVSTANITPNYINSIAFMCVAAAGGTIASGTGWTPDTNGTLSPTGGNLVSFAAQSRIQANTGPLVPAATLGTSNAWAACTVVFRAMHAQQEGTHITQGGTATVFGSVSVLNGDLINMDVSSFKQLSMHFNNTAESTIVSFAYSNDGVLWLACTVSNMTASTTPSTLNNPNNVMITVPIFFRYFRARVTTYASGNSQATTFLTTLSPGPLPGQTVSFATNPVVVAQQSGVWAIQQSAVWTVGLSNADITLLASAARTTTQTVGDQTNTAARGIRVVLDVTVAGTGSITLEIDARDATSGKAVPLLTGLAVTTVSTNVYEIYPGLTPVANAVVSDVLPKTWRVLITANNANSMTYSCGASYLL